MCECLCVFIYFCGVIKAVLSSVTIPPVIYIHSIQQRRSHNFFPPSICREHILVKHLERFSVIFYLSLKSIWKEVTRRTIGWC